jgi:hypothetical protein
MGPAMARNSTLGLVSSSPFQPHLKINRVMPFMVCHGGRPEWAIQNEYVKQTQSAAFPWPIGLSGKILIK